MPYYRMKDGRVGDVENAAYVDERDVSEALITDYLDALHENERRIDCLDYLIYQIEKQYKETSL